MWVRDEIETIDDKIKNFQKALLNQAEKHIETIMPGFTHSGCTAYKLSTSFIIICRDVG